MSFDAKGTHALYVPVMNNIFDKYKGEYLKRFAAAGVKRVFLAIGQPLLPSAIHREMCELEKNLRTLENAGYEAGAWINSFGFGAPMSDEEKRVADFTRITGLDGEVWGSAFCPTDEGFLSYEAGLIKSCALAGAKLIMLDDDLCLNIRPGLGCACDRHMELFCEALGEKIERSELEKLIYTGGKNKYRTAWYKLMGDTLRDFCRRMRAELDRVSKDVRLGFCGGFTSFDLEGADAIELTKILAGDTKPFLRYSSAPYWTYQNRFPWQHHSHIVEFARIQREWCEGEDMELFTENDSYPRPCCEVPASALECFDFMMAADSSADQLKYMFDYVSSPTYEEGYFEAHLENRELTDAVARAMGHMPAVGVYVHEDMRKFCQMTLPEEFTDIQQVMRQVAFSSSSALLAANGIPTTFRDNGGVTAAFGDAGRTVPLCQKGYILDCTAALELQKRGVDVGILATSPIAPPASEYFAEKDDAVKLSRGEKSGFYSAELCDGAKIQSFFGTDAKGTPSSYTYRNREGMEFLVFLFKGDFIHNCGALCRSRYRQEQIKDFCARVGEPLAAFCGGNCGLYTIVKEQGGRLSVAFVNYSNDKTRSPVFELASEYKSAEFFGCNGRLEGNRVTLEGVGAYEFGAFTVEK